MEKKTELNVVAFDFNLQKLASGFQSGNQYLDSFLKSPVALDNNYGKTYVFLSKENKDIIGYYNLGVGYIEQFADGVRSKLGGAVHINGFALDSRYHGEVLCYTDNGVRVNLSDFLLADCLSKIEKIRDEWVGFTFVTLSSTKEGYSLYLRNGFEDLEEEMHFSVEDSDIECKSMYLTLDLV